MFNSYTLKLIERRLKPSQTCNFKTEEVVTDLKQMTKVNHEELK